MITFKIMKNLLYLIPVILFTGCMGFAIKEKVVGDFYLQATDIEEQLNFAYCPEDENGCFPIVHETVFAAGFNEQYFILKQHPNDNRNVTNYFILAHKEAKEQAGKAFVFTPLTLKEFEQQRKKLHLEKVKFTTVFKDLE
jgi:hypothetical protein